MRKIISLLLCCMLFYGCTATPAETTAPPETTTSPEITSTLETAEPTTAPTEVSLPMNIYLPDENAENFNTIPTTIDALDADLILEMLIENSMLHEDIALNSVELVDSQLNLDFNQAFLDQLLTYGTAGERMMIGCVVNTYLSIYEAENVYITVNGKIIESGHVVYDFPMEFFD
ncbi:MAG: GerMN domain-containing protein [Oscillospiraceae bacterium]|nr:GerMN domain-containing protein [Oscillospiraceae bacterium]